MDPPARKILLEIEYDGSSFHGWQAQSGVRTVEAEVAQAIRAALGSDPAELRGASRTDAGVHALGQAVTFTTRSPVPTQRVAQAVNGRLPDDVRVRAATEKEAGFDPRSDAVGKIYRYTFLCRETPSTILRRFVTPVRGGVDVDAMRGAAVHLVGEKDFECFRNRSKEEPESSVREIFGVHIERERDLLHVQVAGSGFLYKMVRNLAGTLLDVGRGRRDPDSIPAAIASRDRRATGPTAPASGLCLIGVYFVRSALDRDFPVTGFVTPL